MEKSFLINHVYCGNTFSFSLSLCLAVPLLPLCPNVSLTHSLWSLPLSQSLSLSLSVFTHILLCYLWLSHCPLPCICLLYVGHGSFKSSVHLNTIKIDYSLIFKPTWTAQKPFFSSISIMTHVLCTLTVYFVCSLIVNCTLWVAPSHFICSACIYLYRHTHTQLIAFIRYFCSFTVSLTQSHTSSLLSIELCTLW